MTVQAKQITSPATILCQCQSNRALTWEEDYGYFLRALVSKDRRFYLFFQILPPVIQSLRGSAWHTGSLMLLKHACINTDCLSLFLSLTHTRTQYSDKSPPIAISAFHYITWDCTAALGPMTRNEFKGCGVTVERGGMDRCREEKVKGREKERERKMKVGSHLDGVKTSKPDWRCWRSGETAEEGNFASGVLVLGEKVAFLSMNIPSQNAQMWMSTASVSQVGAKRGNWRKICASSCTISLSMVACFWIIFPRLN